MFANLLTKRFICKNGEEGSGSIAFVLKNELKQLLSELRLEQNCELCCESVPVVYMLYCDNREIRCVYSTFEVCVLF